MGLMLENSDMQSLKYRSMNSTEVKTSDRGRSCCHVVAVRFIGRKVINPIRNKVISVSAFR